jgi:hypothetical protein
MGKESDLYDPLNTKTLGGDLRLDVDTYENVQDNIHLEGVTTGQTVVQFHNLRLLSPPLLQARDQ